MKLHDARNGTPPFAVPSFLLADVLNEQLTRINIELNGHPDDDDDPDGGGAIAAISSRVSRQLGNITVESVPRRVWSIRRGETVRTSTEMADALLLACDIHIEDTKLPTLPCTTDAALEMANVWAPRLSKLERRRLAKQLYSFSKGFFDGISAEPDDLIERKAAQMVGRFLRAHGGHSIAERREQELIAA